MANRLRVTVLGTVAALNLATLGAGIAVASLLPGRLALWDIPRVAAAPLVRPSAVLPAASPPPAPATGAGLASALGPRVSLS
ncbi:MAG: hypothetical protein J2P34_07690, partial [Actinobacteria bacterium]|nr:hypothetical protein [Actinomycetota bacterium]